MVGKQEVGRNYSPEVGFGPVIRLDGHWVG
jgi:hypothetical protein